MRIVNEDGISQGTKVFTDSGEEIELVSRIELVFDVDEVVVARIEVLKPVVNVEVLPQNCHWYTDTNDYYELRDMIKLGDQSNIARALNHINYMIAKIEN